MELNRMLLEISSSVDFSRYAYLTLSDITNVLPSITSQVRPKLTCEEESILEVSGNDCGFNNLVANTADQTNCYGGSCVDDLFDEPKHPLDEQDLEELDKVREMWDQSTVIIRAPPGSMISKKVRDVFNHQSK